MSVDVLSRLMRRIVKDDATGCWNWIGYRNRGYGRATILGKSWFVHRWMWQHHNGPIPDGLFVCHDCPYGDNPSCCNPEHLWLGTSGENMEDMARKGRAATGDRHGSRTHPERVPSGNEHFSRLHPEKLCRGAERSVVIRRSCHRGEARSNSKLTASDVIAIRQEHASGKAGYRRLSSKYGVSAGVICRIIKRKTWMHLP